MYTTAGIFVGKCLNLVLQKNKPLYVDFVLSFMRSSRFEIPASKSVIDLIYVHDNQEKMQNCNCSLLFSQNEARKSRCNNCL